MFQKKKSFIAVIMLLLSIIFINSTMPVLAYSSTTNNVDTYEEYQYESIEEAMAAFETTIVLDEWYARFNSLTPEEQATINYRPPLFVETQKNIYGIDVPVLPSNEQPVFYRAEISEEWLNQSEGNIDTRRNETPVRNSLPINGYELPYYPAYWNQPSIKNYANCYTYALGGYSNNYGGLDPGMLANIPLLPQYFNTNGLCALIWSDIQAMLGGSLVYPPPQDRWVLVGETQTARPLYYKTAMCIDPGWDYHFYRQDSSGYWSHKRGITDVIDWDASYYAISNPRTANRNYSSANYTTWCGFYEYKYY